MDSRHSIRYPIVRSKLFVPGSRPELFAKAMASACDAISFDLEDAVMPDQKPEARTAVANFLRAGKAKGKVTIVRVNGLSTGLFTDDMEALAGAGVDVINVPKVESREDILAAAHALTGEAGLLATIETPKGLRLAHEIAAAHPRVVGLQIGYADLFGATGMDRRDIAAVTAVRLAVRFAAAEAGVDSYDGAFLNVKDSDGFRTEAEAARRQGFTGKSCIHPSQIALANQVFSPSTQELEGARRVLTAAENAGSRGLGAFLMDGKMVDRPVIARAQAVVALAERLAALPSGASSDGR